MMPENLRPYESREKYFSLADNIISIQMRNIHPEMVSVMHEGQFRLTTTQVMAAKPPSSPWCKSRRGMRTALPIKHFIV
jgi:hypothetical protein